MDKVAAMKKTVASLKLDCLVILGGNGTHKTANLLREEGVPVITLPKTIDNDLWGTDVTFGFQSAVDVAANVIDYIHSTATSHGRVFIVEIMGHKVGWLTLHAESPPERTSCCCRRSPTISARWGPPSSAAESRGRAFPSSRWRRGRCPERKQA